jgi:hypothetical protein
LFHNRSASVAALRKPFAFGPECRSRSLRNQCSPSPESSLNNINQPGGDQAFPYGGISGDVPIVGDWNGDGTSKVGVFRSGFYWVLDGNGNHQFDGTGAGQDLAFAFGGISGDKPVAGKW